MRSLSTIVAVAVLLLAGCAANRPTLRVESPYLDLAGLRKGQIVHLPTGRLLTEEELLTYLGPYPVVYVGESHDSVDDHQVQLAILRGLTERHPGRIALGMEMLRRPYQEEVDEYLRGDLGGKDFLRVWQKNWGPRSFPYYRDILEYARESGIPVLALNAGNDLKDAVRDQGEEGLEPEMRARLPEMDFEDPHHKAFMAGMFGGHVPGSNHLDAFYRVQVLWDETMAQTAAEWLTAPENAEKKLLIFAGGNHVRYGFGIPRRLFRRVPVPYAIVDPYTVEMPEEKLDRLMDVEVPELPMPPADIYWATGYEDLEGDRVMLGVRIEDAEEGVRVLGVVPGSSAAEAGIETGDVITAMDDVAVKEVFDLTYQVGLHKPGDVGPVRVLRGGEVLDLEIRYDVIRHGAE